MVPTRVSWILLAGVFLLCLYRAATQSFTIDESFTFLRYVDAPWRDTFGEYSANNHVLFSLVSRIFRYKFGRSEIVLRIPTLIGCLLFLLASFRMCRQAIGDRWILPVALAILALNPLVLDFFVAARGYGVAMGLFWWALYLLWNDKLWAAGVLAGLSIAANLIFLIPLAALGLIAIPIYVRQRRFWELIQCYGIPSVLISFVVLVIPLTKSSGQFYYGAATLSDTVSSLVNESFSTQGDVVSRTVIPVLFAVGVLTGAWLLVRAIRGSTPESMLLALVLGCMGVSVVVWMAMHRFAGFVYPLNRTAIYMLPLAGLAVALGAATSPWRIVSWPLIVCSIVVAASYVVQLRTGYFNEWRHEAGMNKLVQRLGSDARVLSGTRPVTAGGTWVLEYTVRYYGKRLRLPWLQVLDAKERESIQPDYYFLTPDEGHKIDELHLKVIEKDALSGTVLARRS